MPSSCILGWIEHIVLALCDPKYMHKPNKKERELKWLTSNNNIKWFTRCPVSAFQAWTFPSDEPLNTNWESGLKEASSANFLSFKWPYRKRQHKYINFTLKISYVIIFFTVSEWVGLPWKASTKRITPPLVDRRIVLPSGLNLRPVHSKFFSCGTRKDAKGP